MSAPVQNNPPPPPRRSRIVISLDKARERLHLPPHAQQQQQYQGGYYQQPGRRRRWPVVLIILGALLLGLFIGGYLYWRNLRTKPAYSLALLIDAAQRNDAAAFDQVVDTNRIVEGFVPQVIDQAGRAGAGVSTGVRMQAEMLLPKLLPAFAPKVRDEMMRLVRDNSARAAGKPFFIVALAVPYIAEIRQEGETARVSAQAGGSPVELTMQRNGDARWQVVAIRDDALARRVVDALARDLPSIGSIIGTDILPETKKKQAGKAAGRR
ncbi:MAG TPA: hypothetical protein VF723_11555 [Pyrinomonadaceae bacterium]|jgi:hypothetical protein